MDSTPHRSARRNVFDIFVGFCIAGVLIHLSGVIFRTSPSLYAFNSALGFAVRQDGSFKQERNENWVTNRYGKLGLEAADAAKLSSPRKKVVLLGDSFIEAAMIPGPCQMQNLVTLPDADCLAVGYSGISGPEYCYLMRHLPRAIPDISAFVIFVGDVYDQKGVRAEACRADSPGSLPRTSSSRLDRLTARFRFYSVRAVLRRWRLFKCDFLGNHWRVQNAGVRAAEPVFFPEVCRELKQAAGGRPLLVVYAPQVPRIAGKGIDFTDPEKVFAGELAETCRKLGIGFVSLEAELVRYYQEAGKFPYGFFNTPPGRGHLNEAGHAIAARAISRWFQEKR